MPHQCTNCGRTFPDGSKEMLSGCPDCGGNKFKFEPTSVTDEADTEVKTEQSTTTAESTATADHPSPTTDEPFADHEWPNTASTEPPDAHDKTGRAGQPTIDVEETISGDGTESTFDTSDQTRVEAAGTNEPSQSADEPSQSADEPSQSADEPSQSADEPSQSTDEPSQSAGGFEYSSAAERSAASRSSDTATNRSGVRSDERPHADAETADGHNENTENSAQATARSEVVSRAELPNHSGDRTSTSTTTNEPADAATADNRTDTVDGDSMPPDTDDQFDRIREELNEQFESIRIVRPGEYELNLVELYDREEFIISLREDGRYVIEMSDAWDTGTN